MLMLTFSEAFAQGNKRNSAFFVLSFLRFHDIKKNQQAFLRLISYAYNKSRGAAGVKKYEKCENLLMVKKN